MKKEISPANDGVIRGILAGTLVITAGVTMPGVLPENKPAITQALSKDNNEQDPTNTIGGELTATSTSVGIELTPTPIATVTEMSLGTEPIITSEPVELIITQETTEVASNVEETEMPEVSKEVVSVSGWTIEVFENATDQMKEWVKTWGILDPVKWPNFPNVDNKEANFVASDGLEYGMDESVYCQQDKKCDIPVAAGHERIITGDYNIPGMDACTISEDGQGCGIMIINVGNVTANFRDSMVDTGFTVTGRYWNGDKLPEAINGGLSHVANNMLNLNSPLNPNYGVNAGANCSVVEGCKSVRLAFVIVSGNEVLVKGVTYVNR